MTDKLQTAAGSIRRLIFTRLWANEFNSEGCEIEVVGPADGLPPELITECRSLAEQNGCGLSANGEVVRQPVLLRWLVKPDEETFEAYRHDTQHIVECQISESAPPSQTIASTVVWGRSYVELCVALRMALSPQGLIGCDLADVLSVIENRTSECLITSFAEFPGQVGLLQRTVGAAVNFSFYRRLIEIDDAINVWRDRAGDIDFVWQGSLRRMPPDQVDLLLARAAG